MKTKQLGIQPKKVLPALLGTVVEYYDYALYGLCAAALAQHFFPSEDTTVSLLKAYGVFAIGSFAKPLGALFFGYIGDKKGRRFALQISMIGVAVPTTVMAFLPDYKAWGWMASGALILCRFFQGFFVAGEADGVALYVYEHVDKSRACFANSLCHLASGSGIFFASSVIEKQFDFGFQEAWRAPFLIGGFLGAGVLLLRQFITETPDYIATQFDIVEPFRLRSFLLVALLVGSIGGMYQYVFIFMPSFFVETSVVAIEDKAKILSWMLLCYTSISPFIGLLADKVGHERVMWAFGVCVLVCGSLVAVGAGLGGVSLFTLLLTSICLSGFHTPGFVVLAKHFPVTQRYRSLAIGHAIGALVFSGSTPLVALTLYKVSGMVQLPFVYFTSLVLMGLSAVFYVGRIEKFART